MNRPKLLWIFFSCWTVLLFSSSHCIAQDIPWTRKFFYERYTEQDGLSSEHIRCILKDRQGFMWVGTENGLNRYDGYEFKTFMHIEDDPGSISDNYIFCMSEDEDGFIWVGTFYGGLNRYNPSTESFIRFPVSNDTLDMGSATIDAIESDGSGNIWFSLQGDDLESVFKIDRKTFEIECIARDSIDPSKPMHIHCHSMKKGMDGKMWIGFQDGVLCFDPATLQYTVFEIEGFEDRQFSREGICVFEDYEGKIWVGTWGGGLYRYNKKAEKLTRIGPEVPSPNESGGNYIGAITEDKTGNLILRTAGGLSLLDKENLKFKHLPYPHLEQRITYLSQMCIFYDANGLLWLGASAVEDVDPGLYKVYLDQHKFRYWSVEDLDQKNPEIFWCSSFHTDSSGANWLGGAHIGLKKYKYDIHGPGKAKLQLEMDFPISLSDQVISAIHCDLNNQLWAGNWRNGALYRIDSSDYESYHSPEMESIESFRYEAYYSGALFRKTDDVGFTGAGSMRIHELNDGRLLLARGTSLELFDPVSGQFYNVTLNDAIDSDVLPLFTSITEDPEGTIWLGSMYQGLVKLTPPFHEVVQGVVKAEDSRCFKYESESSQDLGNHMITSLCAPCLDDDIVLWIGTKDQGLYGMRDSESVENHGSGSFVQYSKDNGLSSNTVYGILEDEAGSIWISSDKGLSRFDPGSQRFTSYGEKEGVAVQSFHWLSSYKSSDGWMYFGGINGIISFHPDSIFMNSIPPPLAITSFRLFNEEVVAGLDSPLKQSITGTEKLKLTYKDNYLSFTFAALNHVHTEKNQYRYMLAGADRDWIDAGTSRTASYPNLRPGKYTFQVLASNNDSFWTEDATKLYIHIKPPPWLSWWAYCVYALILIAGVMWYRNFLIRSSKLKAAVELERMEKEKIRELERLKSRFLANLSHEFRTPLTLLLGPINDQLKQLGGHGNTDPAVLKSMKRNAERLQQLINQLLDLSKIESGKMHLSVSKGDLHKLTSILAGSFISQAESMQLEYSFNVQESSEEIYFDPDKVEKILMNLLSNALKFTKNGGSVSLDQRYEKDPEDSDALYVFTAVKDTGPGISQEEQDRIFDRFYQVSEGDSRLEEGSGIGLALTRELIELYRGSIDIKSECGKGSIFAVRLPASKKLFSDDEIVSEYEGIIAEADTVDDQDQQTMDSDVGIHSAGSTGPENGSLILVVEDNEDLRAYISTSLNSEYRILEAENGVVGLDKAFQTIPDIVISDLMMPEMGGLEMAEKLKTNDLTSHVPIILLTARADKESKLESFGIGADDYITKPFDAEVLRARVENLLEQRQRLREKFRKEFALQSPDREEPAYEDEFITRTKAALSKNIADPEYNVKQLAKDMSLSESQLYRKLMALTDLSPNEFIRNSRLKEAATLFQKGHTNVASVLYEVGFNTPSHFSKSFKELYGRVPSDYIKELSRNAAE